MTNFLLNRFIFFEAFESQSQMGKGALCPNLNVFGFFLCRYAYAHDKNLKNIRKDFVCEFKVISKIVKELIGWQPKAAQPYTQILTNYCEGVIRLLIDVANLDKKEIYNNKIAKKQP